MTEFIIKVVSKLIINCNFLVLTYTNTVDIKGVFLGQQRSKIGNIEFPPVLDK